MSERKREIEDSEGVLLIYPFIPSRKEFSAYFFFIEIVTFGFGGMYFFSVFFTLELPYFNKIDYILNS